MDFRQYFGVLYVLSIQSIGMQLNFIQLNTDAMEICFGTDFKHIDLHRMQCNVISIPSICFTWLDRCTQLCFNQTLLMGLSNEN